MDDMKTLMNEMNIDEIDEKQLEQVAGGSGEAGVFVMYTSEMRCICSIGDRIIKLNDPDRVYELKSITNNRCYGDERVSSTTYSFKDINSSKMFLFAANASRSVCKDIK